MFAITTYCQTNRYFYNFYVKSVKLYIDFPLYQSSSDLLTVEAVDYYNSFAITSEEIGNRIIDTLA